MKQVDILVIGGGPAGLGAAISAAEAGCSVLLIDENPQAGGQLYKQIHKFFGSSHHYAGTRGYEIATVLLTQAQTLGVEFWLESRGLGQMDDGSICVLKDGAMAYICAKKVILATGAKENALPFSGWTLPGVMTAGAAQTFCNIHHTLVGKRILMVGSGNVGLIVTYQLLQAGAQVVALVEAAPKIGGYQVHAGKIQRAGVPIYTSHTVVKAVGGKRVEQGIICAVDSSFQPIAGTEKALDVDTILLAVGLNPRTELAQIMGCQHTFQRTLGGHMPIHDQFQRSSVQNVYVCGDLAGVEEASTALEEGRLAGLHAAYHLTTTPHTGDGLAHLQARLSDLRGGHHGILRQQAKDAVIHLAGALTW